MSSRIAAIGLALCVGLTQGCARVGSAGARSGHDLPVPASEPRAELELDLDLPQSSSCEEDFDLALYEDPGVDFIAWRRSATGCSGRHVTIRYLPRRLERAALLERVQGLASKVRVEP